MIAIIDYGVGNLGSVINAFKYLGLDARVTSNKEEILSADKVILPGVGAFSDAMNSFEKQGFVEVINELIKKNTPILGICVGMQMLFEYSYEYGKHKGLGLLPGNIVRFDDSKYKVPHMGWNEIKVIKDNPLLAGVDKSFVYFVHSYHLDNSIGHEIAETNYGGICFPCAVNKDNVYGVQFHPEKSGEVGLKILKNFGDL
ncbi:MAG: imidazole glycerol phosphate synthase subunit HisH [Anaeroplasma sp.]